MELKTGLKKVGNNQKSLVTGIFIWHFLFQSVNCLESPSPSALSVTCHRGLHAASFLLQCFPTIHQDSSINNTYFFSLSDNLSLVEALQYVSSPPQNVSSGQSMITFKIPGQRGFLLELLMWWVQPTYSM